MRGWILGIMALIAWSCSAPEKESNDQFKVVCTTTMIADAVNQIGKGEVEVVSLMGPGIDPHYYKATQGDIAELRSADLVLYNGLELEGKMGDVLAKLGRSQPVLAIADQVTKNNLIELENQNVVDPHIWFDATIWSQCVYGIASKMIRHQAMDSATILQNTQSYLDSLANLHRWVGEEIGSIPENQRLLITSHDAFGYFSRAYNIQVLGLQGVTTTAEFGLKDVTDMVDTIVKRRIKAVFVESSVPSKYMDAVMEGCRSKGYNVKNGGTLYSDALGDVGGPAGTYAGMLRENVKTIVSALR